MIFKRRYLAMSVVFCMSVISACNWDALFKLLVKIPIVGWLIAYNFPPSDYYQPLAASELRAESFDLNFACKYEGRHEIQIIGIYDLSFRESNVGMYVCVKNKQGDVILRQGANNAKISGGGRVDNGVREYNYCYAVFEVPSDVPCGQNMTAKIKCFGNLGVLTNAFPSARVVVRKVFDK